MNMMMCQSTLPLSSSMRCALDQYTCGVRLKQKEKHERNKEEKKEMKKNSTEKVKRKKKKER